MAESSVMPAAATTIRQAMAASSGQISRSSPRVVPEFSGALPDGDYTERAAFTVRPSASATTRASSAVT
jgi:hypothetical protein